MTLERGNFIEPLQGDEWAREHPTEHAREVRETKARVQDAKQKLLKGQSVKLGDLAPRTTRDLLNEVDRWLRKRMEDD